MYGDDYDDHYDDNNDDDHYDDNTDDDALGMEQAFSSFSLQSKSKHWVLFSGRVSPLGFFVKYIPISSGFICKIIPLSSGFLPPSVIANVEKLSLFWVSSSQVSQPTL